MASPEKIFCDFTRRNPIQVAIIKRSCCISSGDPLACADADHADRRAALTKRGSFSVHSGLFGLDFFNKE
jgi:hypothetical protein